MRWKAIIAAASFLPLAGAAAIHSAGLVLAINVTSSLPERVWIIDTRCAPGKGAFAAFRWPGGYRVPKGLTLIKEVAAVAGERVSVDGGLVHAGGRFLGRQSALGKDLAATPGQVLAPGTVWVHAPHPRSLDSRYTPPGPVQRSWIRGCARPLF